MVLAYLHIVSCVEGFQVKLSVWLGSPQAQIDGVVSLEAWNGIVVSNCCHLRTPGCMSAQI